MRGARASTRRGARARRDRPAAGADWYDYEAKYADGGMELRRAGADLRLGGREVRRLAREAFLRVGCAGLARVDFFVEGERVLVNELNTMPGFTATSVFPKLWEASGLPYPRALDRLLGFALERSSASARHARRPRTPWLSDPSTVRSSGLLASRREERDLGDHRPGWRPAAAR